MLIPTTHATAAQRPPQPAGLQITDNTGRVLAKRVRGRRTILALTYNENEAERLRHLASHITIKGDKHPSMSLLARFGLQVISELHERDPVGLAARLGRMATAVPHPATYSKKEPKQ